MLHIAPLSSPPALPGVHQRGLGTCLTSSAQTPSPFDRWSFFPHPPTRRLVCAATGHAVLSDAAGAVQTFQDPRAALAWIDSTLCEPPHFDPDLPPFVAGWIGYLSYDLGRFFEVLPQRSVDDLRLPLFIWSFHPGAYALDHHTGRWFHTTCTGDLVGPPLERESAYCPAASAGPLHSTHTPESFRTAVARVIEYIKAGDVFQVNLSHRFSTPLVQHPARIFEQARQQVPARYGAFLDYGDFALVGNSPELFLQVTPRPDGSRQILTRPIKGTRPRQPGMDWVLRESAKDQAELNMIIDLQRNDLGRICRLGSVHVTEPRTIETHPTVHHGVATISGLLRESLTLPDLLAATFPGGSVTGAPKIRAMQIIDELEPVRRGPYCGAIGFLSLTGHLTLSLAIRTLVATPDTIHFNVGGGIVADSTPADEYHETLVKARQLLTALNRPLTID